MTTRQFMDYLSSFPEWVMWTIWLAPPVLSWIAGMIHGQGRGGSNPWKYMYAILIYWVCVPGVLSALLTGYSLFFVKENLLDQNLFVYIIPIVAMGVTLPLIRKNVPFDEVPGFDRLSGLITVIAITFGLALAIYKTRFWVDFGGSIYVLGGLLVALFALLQWGAHLLFRGRHEPKRERPKFDDRAM